MTKSDFPSDVDILNALRDSGYLVEQEVASTLESLGFTVQTNRAFNDIDEGKSRELDVWAIKQVFHDEQSKISIFIELLCECKNAKNPLVFLTRPKNEMDFRRVPQEYIFPVERYQQRVDSNSYREIPAFEYLGLARHHRYYQDPRKAVQFTRITRKGSAWEANHGDVFNALFFPLVKAMLARRKDLAPYRSNWANLWLFFPMVVTVAPLYAVDADSSEPQLDKKPFVTFVRELHAKDIDGYFTVDFVVKDSINEFIDTNISPFYEHLVDMARTTPDIFTNRRYEIL